jgi:integrase
MKNWTSYFLERLPKHTTASAASNYEIRDASTTGLTLQVGVSGAKIFWFRFTFNSKKYAIRIGLFPAVSLEEARKKAQQFRAVLEHGENPADELRLNRTMMTVAEFAERDYMPNSRANKISHKSDFSRLRDHVLPTIGALRLNAVTGRDIQSLLDSLKGKLAPATINRVHALISVFFNLAVRFERIEKSPCTKIPKLRELTPNERFLSIEELKRVLEAADKEPNRVAANAIKALAMTGMRREEVLQSKKINLNTDNGTLFLPCTKGGKSRHVILNDRALTVFTEMKNTNLESEYLFPGKYAGRPLNNPRKAFTRILKNADVEYIKIHSLRHTYCSILVGSGVSLYVAQNLLGHASASTTTRYAHLGNEALRAGAQIVDGLLNSI